MTSESDIFRTNISQAFWCTNTPLGAEFQEAQITLPDKKDPIRVSWFDELLEGGLYLPKKCERPLTVLIAGPPGSGKTTFAMELCYRLAKNEASNSENLFTLYISTEQPANQLIENAIRFGYKDAQNIIVDFEVDNKKPNKFDKGRVAVWGRDRLQELIKEEKNNRKAEDLELIIDGAINALTLLLLQQARSSYRSRRLIEHILNRKLVGPIDNDQVGKVQPDILVVDSLNVVVPDLRKEFFERFQSAISTGCRMVIFVLDTSSTGDYHDVWEYASDVVFRFDSSAINDYFLRTIQIIKARYQSHVWGEHQLKIYKKPTFPARENPNYEEILRRSHPYRNEGGIFIYPSIHYYLSTYKRRGPTEQVSYASTKPNLDGVLMEGIPEGRCTAFIGCRGGHKSHFGYLHLLHRIIECQHLSDNKVEQEEAALVISLRDDEKMTLHTMESIRKSEFPNSMITLRDLQHTNKLEILYYHPGYITPEEFFNRMFISIHRLKQGGERKLTVLFNSVDQVSSRFPLCAKQQIFIPGIIEALTGEGATSILIAVDEPGQPAELYGLLPMADLILSFYPYRIPYLSYFQHLNESRKLTHETEEYRKRIDKWQEEYIVSQDDKNPQGVEAVVLQVVRFAGGQKAGAKGILELVGSEPSELGLYERPGLHFTKLSPKFFHGTRIRREIE